MSFGASGVLYAFLFIGVILLVEGVFALINDFRSGPRAHINRRMQMLAAGRHGSEVLTSLRRGKPQSALARVVPLYARLDRLLVQAGASVSTSRVLMSMVLVALAVTLGLFLLTPIRGPLLPLLAAVAGIALPVGYFMRQRTKRLSSFEAQFPGALDLLVRSLRVGHPLASALAVVAHEMPDPLGSEFGIVVDEVTYGQELEEALERLSDRVDLQDLRYLTVAVQIQLTSGGNLAEILDGLAKVIRDRFQIFRKVNAITAEGRWSAWFLSLFPIFMAFGVQLVKPDYYTQVADHPLFPILAAITGVLLVLNVVFMRMLTKIKV